MVSNSICAYICSRKILTDDGLSTETPKGPGGEDAILWTVALVHVEAAEASDDWHTLASLLQKADRKNVLVADDSRVRKALCD